MVLKVRFNSVDYDIISMGSNALADIMLMRFSATQTQLTNFSIDFTGKVMADLPIKYQEIQVVDTNTIPDTVLYTGYIDSIQLPEFRTGSEVLRLGLTLLNPIALAVNRTISISKRNTPLATVVGIILAPLVADGFTIEENNLSTTKNVTIKDNMISIEKLMNKLSNRENFTWYIDKDKKMYINPVEELRAQTPILVFDTNNDITFAAANLAPSIEALDYANVLNVKNQNVLISGYTGLYNQSFSAGDIVMFEYPFSISATSGARITSEDGGSSDTILFDIADLATFAYGLVYNYATDDITTDSEIGYDGVDNGVAGKKILLITDPFNKTLVTGIKFVDALASVFTSGISVQKQTSVYYNSNEITANIGKVSTSGKIEKTLNLNGKFLTQTESLEMAKNRLLRTPAQTDEVTLTLKGIMNDDFYDFIESAVPLRLIRINLPEYFVDGDFIITEVTFGVATSDMVSFVVKAKNSNLIANYLDLFRGKDNEIVDEEAVENVVSVLVSGEKIIENPRIIVDGDDVNEDN